MRKALSELDAGVASSALVAFVAEPVLGDVEEEPDSVVQVTF